MRGDRRIVKVRGFPDPLTLERIEDAGFFFDDRAKTWIRFCAADEVAQWMDYLERRRLGSEVSIATGMGQTRRMPCLSKQLLLTDGGGPTRCALCAADQQACREWIEGDDTDALDYPNAARFYLCGPCVQLHIAAHPRLYAPVEDAL
jgi:hypothetical protein